PVPAPASAAPVSPALGVGAQDRPGAVPDYAMVRASPRLPPGPLPLPAAGVVIVAAAACVVHRRRRRVQPCLAVDPQARPRSR
ncbi:MAG: hypothetical protein M3Y91_17690, partial [Actinomycetota bacterium]|nr:hypothetical protein [Actinomycetota bacterium]